ncbi:Penicillinase repressor [bioreactor metagenome]|uniref:Penicillinase repressor n=2 Tax=root TaxID=1 RepID=A0A0X8VC28_ANAPI|nr:BlaI/MecI/CopY family transcriptional regulator [Anaerotignum propionicum]AMJ40334.1 penicillinase repressor [Anaerotignum propionicum DSM 1682]MEA5057573.1 BlaI/MecI/CopY family transcriptional regulator [Anaerotignum propionicum]SHE44791.1 Predicted transcriptional regulator [[Clostridium] propionicum DSM 1682] [Anaerotignum propionicum DSM 1682]
MKKTEEISRLPDTELEIMKVIWNGEKILSTAEIKERLEVRRSWNISALQTLLNRLIERGFLQSYKEGKNRFYIASVEETTYLALENKLFLNKVNNNSLTKLVASLYDSRAISENDLDELAAYIRNKTGGET